MRLFTIQLFSLCLISLSLSGQKAQLNGSLYESNSPNPISNAAIFLEPGNHQTISDARGKFEFKDLEPGEYSIRIKHISFREHQSKISLKEGKQDFFANLEFKNELMAEAVVNGSSLTGGEKGIRQLSGSAHYLGLKELETYEYNDAIRLLRRIPGVYLQEEDGFGLRPNIGMRGTGVERSSKITLMEDGILAAPAPYSAPSAYYFPTTGRMEGVEVRKGSSQIEYGPYTTGGALNFISTQIPDEFRAKLDVLAGSFGQRRLHAYAGESFTHFGFVVETYQASADGFKELDFGGPTGFDLADYQAKFRLNTSKEAKVYQALELKLAQSINNSDETYLGLSQDDFAAHPYRRYAASGLDRMETDQRQYKLSYTLKPNNNLSIVSTAYRNEFSRNWYKLDKVLSNGENVGIANLLADPTAYADAYQTLIGAGDDTLYVKNNNRSYYAQGLQTKVVYNWNNHQIKAGLRYHEDGMDRFQWNNTFTLNQGDFTLIDAGTPGTESNRIEDARAWAAFAEYRLSWEKWTFNPGLRYESINLARHDYGKSDVDRTGVNLSERENQVEVFIPGLGIRYDINNKSQIFGGIHKGFAPPGSVAGSQPESSINTELGLRSEFNFAKLSATAFYNDYQNLLGSDMAATGGVGNNLVYNGGAASVYGLEAEFQGELRPGASHWAFPWALAYTFTHAQFDNSFESDYEAWGTVNKGDELPYLAEHMLNAQIGAAWKRLALNSSISYQSAMRTQAGSGVIDADHEIPAQWMIDLSGTYHLNYHFSLFASVRNLGDAVNLVAMRPAGLRPTMPRSFLFGIKARW